MQRPTGVILIAILQFFWTGVMVLIGIGLMLGMGIVGAILAQQGRTGAGALEGLGAVFGVVFLFCAAMQGIVAWGMLMLKNWARIVTIVLTALGAAMIAFSLVMALTHFHIFAMLWNMIWGGVYGLIISYLLQPEVARAFQSGGMAQAAGR